LTVAPTGSMKLLICRSAPRRFVTHVIDMGRVAELDEVLKAS